MVTNSTPRFAHDCEECVFLGQVAEDDVWYHAEERDTLIMRESDDPADYTAFPASVARLAAGTAGATSARWTLALHMLEEHKRREG